MTTSNNSRRRRRYNHLLPCILIATRNEILTHSFAPSRTSQHLLVIQKSSSIISAQHRRPSSSNWEDDTKSSRNNADVTDYKPPWRAEASENRPNIDKYLDELKNKNTQSQSECKEEEGFQQSSTDDFKRPHGMPAQTPQPQEQPQRQSQDNTYRNSFQMSSTDDFKRPHGMPAGMDEPTSRPPPPPIAGNNNNEFKAPFQTSSTDDFRRSSDVGAPPQSNQQQQQQQSSPSSVGASSGNVFEPQMTPRSFFDAFVNKPPDSSPLSQPEDSSSSSSSSYDPNKPLSEQSQTTQPRSAIQDFFDKQIMQKQQPPVQDFFDAQIIDDQRGGSIVTNDQQQQQQQAADPSHHQPAGTATTQSQPLSTMDDTQYYATSPPQEATTTPPPPQPSASIASEHHLETWDKQFETAQASSKRTLIHNVQWPRMGDPPGVSSEYPILATRAIVTVLATLSTRYLHLINGVSPVLASSAVALLVSTCVDRRLGQAALCGSFAGMSGGHLMPTVPMAMMLGGLTSICYELLIHINNLCWGIGGRLGATAFLATSMMAKYSGIRYVGRSMRRSLWSTKGGPSNILTSMVLFHMVGSVATIFLREYSDDSAAADPVRASSVVGLVGSLILTNNPLSLMALYGGSFVGMSLPSRLMYGNAPDNARRGQARSPLSSLMAFAASGAIAGLIHAITVHKGYWNGGWGGKAGLCAFAACLISRVFGNVSQNVKKQA